MIACIIESCRPTSLLLLAVLDMDVSSGCTFACIMVIFGLGLFRSESQFQQQRSGGEIPAEQTLHRAA